MGLTIYYGMKTKAEADAARKLVARMYKRIAKLPWDEVTEVFEIDPPGWEARVHEVGGGRD